MAGKGRHLPGDRWVAAALEDIWSSLGQRWRTQPLRTCRPLQGRKSQGKGTYLLLFMESLCGLFFQLGARGVGRGILQLVPDPVTGKALKARMEKSSSEAGPLCLKRVILSSQRRAMPGTTVLPGVRASQRTTGL